MGTRGFQPAQFDCGKYGQMTAAQIAQVSGVNLAGVYERIKKGVTGEALCAEPIRQACEDKSPHWPVPAQDLIEQLDCVRLRKWRGPVTTGPLVPTLGWRVAA